MTFRPLAWSTPLLALVLAMGSVGGYSLLACGPVAPQRSITPVHPEALIPPAPREGVGPLRFPTHSVPVGAQPVYASYNGANGYVYVSNFLSGKVSVLDGISSVGTIPVGGDPYHSLFDATNGYVYVVNQAGYVSVLSGTRVVANVSVGTLPGGISLDGSNGLLYVPNSQSDNVSVLQGVRLLATVAVGVAPVASTVDDANGYVYVVNSASSNVSVLSGTGLLATLSVSSQPLSATYDSADGYVYVPGTHSSNVSVINGTTVVATVPVGSVPVGPATYDSMNGFVYVVTSHGISVLNGTSLWATIPVGSSPLFPTFDVASGYIYLSNSGTVTTPSNVTVLNGTAVLTEVPVGTFPSVLGYDSSDGYVYVPNEGSDNVTVIEPLPVPTQTIHFVETGLPAGTLWSLTLVNGTARYATSPSIRFIEPYGWYNLSVGLVPGYKLVQSPGTSFGLFPGSILTEFLEFAPLNAGPASPSGTGFLGLPGNDGYYLLGGVATTLVAVAIAFGVRSRRR